MTDYHYIIVGAGSAGCVLANRLSADPDVHVLLIEAGGEGNNPMVSMPMGLGKTLTDRALSWLYLGEPETGSGGKPSIFLRGRMLGGSSAVNGMVYCRCHPADYDHWADIGCSSWGWKEMAPIFRKMEDQELGPGGKRGVGGPLHVSIQKFRSPLTEAVLDAADSLGMKRVDDVNEAEGDALGYTPLTIRRGRRWSAKQAFLAPIRNRPNLTVVTDTSVDRLLFDGLRVVGVEGRHNGQPVQYHASVEVILSAGALITPKILQLSGIGPAEHLRSIGVEPRVNSPGVGQHMREHKIIDARFLMTKDYSHNRKLSGWRAILHGCAYMLTRRGVMASTYDLNGFFRTSPAESRPDAQLTFWSLASDGNPAQFATHKEPGFTVMVVPTRPTSEGSVMAQSNDPDAPPIIRPNFLTTEEDRRKIVGAFRFLRQLIAHPEVAPLVKEELWPGPSVQSDEEIVAASRRDGNCQHAVGTCRMGDFPDAVVDARLRVKGVEGLRVMDCSVMPDLPSGNTNGPIMAMAWRAADIIREDRLTKA